MILFQLSAASKEASNFFTVAVTNLVNKVVVGGVVVGYLVFYGFYG